MRVLTAVTPAAPLATDFNFADEAEIVVPNPIICDNTACGCDRTAVGLMSRKSTTTMQVRDVDLSAEEITALLEGYNEQTWDGGLGMALLRRWWAGAVLIADRAPVGSVLRIRAASEDWIVSIEQSPAAWA